MEKSINAQKNGIIEYQKNIKLNKDQSNTKVKILIVEDNYLTQCAIQEMLVQLGYSADFAEDGKTALALYDPSYLLILMDIELPDFTGIKVAEDIRAIEKKQKTKNIPIIAITSHHDEIEYQEKCLAAGMNGCSSKPDLHQLKHLINKYVLH